MKLFVSLSGFPWYEESKFKDKYDEKAHSKIYRTSRYPTDKARERIFIPVQGNAYTVVMCRGPRDIYNMEYAKGLSSKRCFSVSKDVHKLDSKGKQIPITKNPNYSSKHIQEVVFSSIVAFLVEGNISVKERELEDIPNVIGRTKIHLMFKEEGKHVMAPVRCYHGNSSSLFKKAVHDWAENNNLHQSSSGKFEKSSKLDSGESPTTLYRVHTVKEYKKYFKAATEGTGVRGTSNSYLTKSVDLDSLIELGSTEKYGYIPLLDASSSVFIQENTAISLAKLSSNKKYGLTLSRLLISNPAITSASLEEILLNTKDIHTVILAMNSSELDTEYLKGLVSSLQQQENTNAEKKKKKGGSEFLSNKIPIGKYELILRSLR